MKLTAQDTVAALDADFGVMAVKRGQFAWGLEELSMREKSFVFVAADLCCRTLQFPFQAHVTMALTNGITVEDVREAVRHLAPYVGYPTAAEALMRLIEIEKTVGDAAQAGPGGEGENHADREAVKLPDDVLRDAAALNEGFASFLQEQFEERWNRPNLTVAERALCTIATDVLNGTLEESFREHVRLALDNGAGEEKVTAVLLLVAEFGLAKTWRAFTALRDVLAGDR